MHNKLRQFLIGSPLPTDQLSEKRLNKIRALAAFSPDALSSVAYANQEIYLGLVVAGSVGLALALPIGIVIALLLLIVSISYLQTIEAYPNGGGSYVVARENLGKLPGLITAAALLTGYLLTAAVSLTAGVEAIASAFPALWSYRIFVALFLLVLITLANMRGLRESGTLMAIPVYLFLVTFLLLLIIGFIGLGLNGSQDLSTKAPQPTQPLTLFLILHTFATGCTALTGIEAISNGVPSFRSPEIKNAQRTLIVMAILMAILFTGSIALIQYQAVIAESQETILSALARTIVGSGPAYLLIQFSTMAILAVAANTSFAGFPRLAAILASDGYVPRQLTSLGDRLVFSNGILLLAAATAILIIAFGGNSHLLIPLFAIGVFLAFTFSQAGMVLHWWRKRNAGWLFKALLNGLGALTTGATVLIIGFSKFFEGAWITLFVIPILVIMFLRIKNHYSLVRDQLTLHGLPPSLRPFPPPRVVIPVSGIHRGTIEAVNFARSISNNVIGLYIEIDPGSREKTRRDWERWFPDITLEIRSSPYRSIIGPLLKFLDEIDQFYNDGQLAVLVLPEFIPAQWWQSLLHNQTSWLIKTVLLHRRRNLGYQRVIIDVPYHLKR
jgi:amino acid transporter